MQDQGGRGAGLVSGSILAQQDLVPGTHAPRDSPSLANSSEEGSAFSETGHPMAPASGPVETPRMVPGWDVEVLADLPQEVALTITSVRAPSTRRAYTLKWNLFIEWCSSHQEDPRRCSIRAVLSFLQQGLERRLSPSTLKLYVAAISAYHDPVEGKSVGKHNLVVRFLRGARRLNPPRPPSLPSWDLALVLRALITAVLSGDSRSPRTPTVWVALGTAVVDLLCVARSYRLPYRKDQEVYTGHWKGQLLWHFGRDPNSSVIRCDVSVPSFRERGLHT